MSEVLGREYRVVKRELAEEDIEDCKRRMAKAHERKREVEAEFTGFRKWAAPRIRRAVDPDYEPPSTLEGEPVLSVAEAHGLRVELLRRGRHKGAAVAAIRADLEAAEHAAATGVEYRRVECELVAHEDRLEIAYVDVETGEVVDTRAMTASERQMVLPDVESKKKNGRGRKAPDAVA